MLYISMIIQSCMWHKPVKMSCKHSEIRKYVTWHINLKYILNEAGYHLFYACHFSNCICKPQQLSIFFAFESCKLLSIAVRTEIQLLQLIFLIQRRRNEIRVFSFPSDFLIIFELQFSSILEIVKMSFSLISSH